MAEGEKNLSVTLLPGEAHPGLAGWLAKGGAELSPGALALAPKCETMLRSLFPSTSQLLLPHSPLEQWKMVTPYILWI